MSSFDAWLGNAFDLEEAASLTEQLVGIRSLPGEEAAVQSLVADWLRMQGLVPVVDNAAPNRPNVVATIDNGDGPTLLLNGHVDTATIDPRWDESRVWGSREGGRLYGLGAADMKAGVAAAMLATRALDRRREEWRGRVVFSSVVDEEAYSIGAHRLIESGLHADYCLVTEASFDAPCLGAFGKLLVRVDVEGKAAHASWPELGINAAVEAARFATMLGQIPLGSHAVIAPSQSLLSFQSGPLTYQSITVPDHARLLINWHTTPGETREDVLARLEDASASLESPARFVFAIDDPYYPAWETAVDTPIVEAFSAAYQAEVGSPPAFAYAGYGDMNLFSTEAGMPTVMFGPRGANYHAADEWVEIASIGATIRVILRFVTTLLPRGRE